MADVIVRQSFSHGQFILKEKLLGRSPGKCSHKLKQHSECSAVRMDIYFQLMMKKLEEEDLVIP